MAAIDRALLDLGRIDDLARGGTSLHRLDPRAKVVTTLLFVACVASFGRYELARLLPLLLYPAVLMAWGGVPAGYVARRLLAAAPFVLFVAVFNPLLDTAPLVRVGGAAVTGGWISFFSILLRFALTVGAAIVLVAVTGIHPIAGALQRIGVPRVFVLLLLFVYRYIFVLAGEALRVVRAASLRSGGRPLPLRVFGSLAGQLLLRTLDRARRIHEAMLCRGFEGRIPVTVAPRAAGAADALFVCLWLAWFAAARLADLPGLLGRLVVG